MVGQLDLSHTTRAESLGEGVVSENTIGVAALGRFEAALRMSLRQGWGLFNILAWAFRRRARVGRSVGGKGEGHWARLWTAPRGMGAVVGVVGGREVGCVWYSGGQVYAARLLARFGVFDHPANKLKPNTVQ